jgi:hypothetical protein
MKTCELCQSEFPNWIKIDGKNKNLKNRKYCLKCSPWGQHNTINRKKREHTHCIICNSKLKESQLKFCSKACKGANAYQNNPNWYPAQKQRGIDRKKELALLKGGKCESCGYDKNLAALEFHHRDPKNKVSELDSRVLSNRKWDFILGEAEKCLLLCSNCHREHHCDDFNNWKE